MKHLVGKNVKKKVKFLGEEIEIKKLSVKEVLEVQEATKTTEENEQLKALHKIIRLAVTGADELTDDEISEFPLEDLTTLSAEIVKYSGMVAGAVEAGN